MANSVVYSSIFGAVTATLPAVATRLVVFDTAVVDMTEQLDDPGELLFGVQLGGGTGGPIVPAAHAPASVPSVNASSNTE